METKIAEVKGFTIVYEPRDKQFYLKSGDGEIVGQGKTQDEVEVQAEKLAKQNYKFPIQAFLVSGRKLEAGRVTSINIDDPSIRFSYDDKQEGYYGKSNTKCNLKYGSKVCEATDQNRLIKGQVDSACQEISKLEKQIQGLLNQLEKPIDLKYFGLAQ